MHYQFTIPHQLAAAFVTLALWKACDLILLVGRWMIATVKRRHREPGVTPSCGCIMCDLKVERQRSHLGTFHQTQHGIVPCHRS